MNKIKKALFVGIGGAGIDSILYTKRCFIEAYGEIPPMIGFLGIDTDYESVNKVTSKTTQAEKKEPAQNNIFLEKSELLICTVPNPSDVYSENEDLFNWVPKLNKKNLKSISGVGAGQVRSNGRFIAMYNYKNITNQIMALVNKINAPLPPNCKFTTDYNNEDFDFPILVNIACSVAGGTGSGMFIDIMSIIENVLKNQSQKHVIYPWLILPDIYRAINSGPVMANVYYNAYGALRDLDYIMHLSPDDEQLDLGYAKLKESPAYFAFMINNVNVNGTSFNRIEDITETLGRSMFLPSNELV